MRVLIGEGLGLDAVACAYFVQAFVPGAEEAEFVVVDRRWNGEMDHDDFAVGLWAGGRCVKRARYADGSLGTCFAGLVEEYATPEDRQVLESLFEWNEAQAEERRAITRFAPGLTGRALRIVGDNTITGVLRDLIARFPDDPVTVVRIMVAIFTGRTIRVRTRLRARAEADAAVRADRRVAVLSRMEERSTATMLFDRGVEVVVYTDDEGTHAMRCRGSRVNLGHRDVVAVVHAADETFAREPGQWSRRTNYLLGTGTKNAPAPGPSAVSLDELAAVYARLLGPDPDADAEDGAVEEGDAEGHDM